VEVRERMCSVTVGARGIHVRVALAIFKAVGGQKPENEGFDPLLTVKIKHTSTGLIADAKSVLDLLSIGASPGDTVEVVVRHPDGFVATAVMKTLTDIITTHDLVESESLVCS